MLLWLLRFPLLINRLRNKVNGIGISCFFLSILSEDVNILLQKPYYVDKCMYALVCVCVCVCACVRAHARVRDIATMSAVGQYIVMSKTGT